MTENTAGWIRALWPPALALVTIVALVAGILSRLDAAEACTADHENRIRVLEEACAEGMATQALILDELRWMREHWPALNPTAGGNAP